MKLSIQKKYSLAIILVALIPLIIVPIIGYAYTTNVIREKVINLSLQQVKRYGKAFDEVMDDIIVGSNSFSFDSEVQNYLANRDIYIKKPLEVSKNIESKIHSMQTTNWYTYDVETVIADSFGNIYNTNYYTPISKEVIGTSESFQKILDGSEHFIWQNDWTESESDHSLVLIRSIKDEFYNSIGLIGIMVKPSKNDRLVSLNVVDDNVNHIFILDDKGQMILNDRLNPVGSASGIYENMKNQDSAIIYVDDVKSVVTKTDIELTNWTIYQVQSYDAITYDLKSYRNLTIVMNGVFIIVVLVASFFMSKVITKAIVELSQVMSKVSEGDLKVRAAVTGSEEIEALSDNFNGMVERIETLIKKVEVETKAKEEKHFEALQAQINPHFLLNTLNGIKWLVVMKDNQKAESMLMALGTLLERTLGKNKSIITLEDELQTLRYYGDIQSYRYGESFELIFDVDKSLNHVLVPALILQPLVENSILHGFTGMDKKGIITIKAYSDKDYVYLQVIDNGLGMDPEMLELYKKNIQNATRIGIRSVDERISLYYDETCHLIIDSSHTGTQITLRIRDYLEV
ncbi:sensor histidine kinase [Acidaminobacter sp. JC074]|uniref:sensor histidine kinase n=1 Tax=Acidaminobacter sp. JC074 TaxID=2530199 RepID=UPI001F10FE73|nr:sensor histidine kinase [Acidaminobacter sp. JC074]MCH4888604.1 sensor histidine kinase [Acidaminobacter sp. JC074]